MQSWNKIYLVFIFGSPSIGGIAQWQSIRLQIERSPVQIRVPPHFSFSLKFFSTVFFFQFHSTFTQEHLAMFSEHLNALRSFIERNPQLMASSPNDSLVQSASPNVHQRLLNFMRPEGMSTASPLHIQQSLQAKYRSKRLRSCSYLFYFLHLPCCCLRHVQLCCMLLFHH